MGTYNAGGITYDNTTWATWNASQPGNIYFPAEGVTMFCQSPGCQLWAPDDESGDVLSSGLKTTRTTKNKNKKKAKGNRQKRERDVEEEKWKE